MSLVATRPNPFYDIAPRDSLAKIFKITPEQGLHKLPTEQLGDNRYYVRRPTLGGTTKEAYLLKINGIL